MKHALWRKKALVAAIHCLCVGTAAASNYTASVTATPGAPVVMNPGDTVTVSGDGESGVVAQGNGATLTGTQVDISTSGSLGFGVNANGGSVSLSGGQVSTSGALADAVVAQNGGTVSLDGTQISTSELSARGIVAKTGGTVNGSNVSVTTSEDGSVGANAIDGSINLSDSSIATSGYQAFGVVAVGTDAQITLTDSSVSTTGNGAAGVQAQSGATVSLSNTSVKTSGNSANGIDSLGSGSTLTANQVSVETSGQGSAALHVSTSSSIVGSNVKASTSGDNAAAIYNQGGDVSLSNSTVSTTGQNSAGIRLESIHGSTQHVSLDNTSLTTAQSDAIDAIGASATVDLSNGSSVSGGNGVLVHASSSEDNGNSQVTINADGNVRMNGDVIADSGSVVDMNLSHGSTLTGAASNGGTFTLDNSSRWNVTADSDLLALNLNGGTVAFQSSPSTGGFETLTVGSLGGSGGNFDMNAVLNEGGANSQSDQIVVTGDVSGQYGITVNNQGGSGAQTEGDGILLVDEQGSAPSGSFYLNQPVQAGAYQYLLYQGGATSPEDWYLRSDLEGSGGTSTGAPPAYRPAVPGYVMAPMFNLDYGFSTLGNLNERVGDIGAFENGQRLSANDGVWARLGGQKTDADAGRFSGESRSFFAQFGKDWTVANTADGGSVHAGAMLTLGTMDNDFSDPMRAINPTLSTSTGSGDTQAQSIGGYLTRYFADGLYLDGVAQLTHYSNDYSDSTGVNASQDGYGIALSGEIGKAFVVASNGLAIEPQAQLMYQHLSLDDFNDGVSSVSSDAQNALRGRVGVRMFRADLNKTDETGRLKPQFTANVLHDFVDPGSVDVGGTDFDPSLSRTWYEVGVGATAALGKDSSLYVNVKYSHNLDGDAYKNVYGQAGLRYSW
ncbi:autotransporter outer membrane beta-barrel domain-containing protein [Jeongeupia wiesaeckerbachi]|uniref:autotransporter family protein n=1 Tax=Jeongeupia wiesaeckerbachi TaxID=3051218 RepID=UPI003D8085C9